MTKPAPSHLLPSPEELHRILRYDPETGKLWWKERSAAMFKHCRSPKAMCATFNAQFADKEAFTSKDGKGYHYGTIWNGPHIRAHRVIWAMVYGEWPSDQIDHEDHARTNNKIANLKPATNQTNQRNRKLSRRNTSGATGVVWQGSISKWRARIRQDGKHLHLGVFSKFEDAVSARKAAEKLYGYHDNHGRVL